MYGMASHPTIHVSSAVDIQSEFYQACHQVLGTVELLKMILLEVHTVGDLCLEKIEEGVE